VLQFEHSESGELLPLDTTVGSIGLQVQLGFKADSMTYDKEFINAFRKANKSKEITQLAISFKENCFNRIWIITRFRRRCTQSNYKTTWSNLLSNRCNSCEASSNNTKIILNVVDISRCQDQQVWQNAGKNHWN
jgi:hypothetical protein